MGKRRVVSMLMVLVWGIVLTLGISYLSLAQEKPTYKVVSDISWPPFEMVDEQGNYVGFDLDVMRAIADLKGYNIEIKDLAFDSIIPAVAAGLADIGASGFTITDEREKQVDFSNSYWTSDQAIIIRADSGLNIVTALSSGRKVGAQRGTTGADWIQTNLIDQGIKVELKLYETYPLAVLDLVNGNLDAVIQDEPATRASLKKQQSLGLAGLIITGEEFGFLVAEGDPKGILPKINQGMAELKASGEWEKLIARYFGE